MRVDSAVARTKEAAKEVFSRGEYLALAIGMALLLFGVAVLLPNASLLAGPFPPAEKLRLAWNLLGGFETNFTPFSRFIVAGIAVLFGVNVSFSLFAIRRRFLLRLAGGSGWWGSLLGLIGIGCISCGSVILTSLFGIGLTATVVGFLPLKGAEFGLAGILVLIVGIMVTAKNILDPAVCIDRKGR